MAMRRGASLTGGVGARFFFLAMLSPVGPVPLGNIVCQIAHDYCRTVGAALRVRLGTGTLSRRSRRPKAGTRRGRKARQSADPPGACDQGNSARLVLAGVVSIINPV